MGELAAEYEVPIILMHMQGTPTTMQAEPKYKDVVQEVLDYLLERANRAEKAGVPKERIFIDPGIGFGKTLEHNLELLRNIEKFVAIRLSSISRHKPQKLHRKNNKQTNPIRKNLRHRRNSSPLRRRRSINSPSPRRPTNGGRYKNNKCNLNKSL